MLARGCPWILCIDNLHDEDLDLLSGNLRDRLDTLIELIVFLVVGGPLRALLFRLRLLRRSALSVFPLAVLIFP